MKNTWKLIIALALVVCFAISMIACDDGIKQDGVINISTGEQTEDEGIDFSELTGGNTTESNITNGNTTESNITNGNTTEGNTTETPAQTGNGNIGEIGRASCRERVCLRV